MGLATRESVAGPGPVAIVAIFTFLKAVEQKGEVGDRRVRAGLNEGMIYRVGVPV